MATKQYIMMSYLSRLAQKNMNSIEDTRYPSEGSKLFSTAFYANMLKRFSHKIQLESGIRYTFSQLPQLRANYLNTVKWGGRPV